MLKQAGGRIHVFPYLPLYLLPIFNLAIKPGACICACPPSLVTLVFLSNSVRCAWSIVGTVVQAAVVARQSQRIACSLFVCSLALPVPNIETKKDCTTCNAYVHLLPRRHTDLSDIRNCQRRIDSDSRPAGAEVRAASV